MDRSPRRPSARSRRRAAAALLVAWGAAAWAQGGGEAPLGPDPGGPVPPSGQAEPPGAPRGAAAAPSPATAPAAEPPAAEPPGDEPPGDEPPGARPPVAEGAGTDADDAEPSNPLAKLPLIGRFFGGDRRKAADADTVPPHYRLDVDAPDPVDRQIRDHTLLGRWRRRADYDPSQLPLFVRRADGEVRELLAAEGWFSPEVEVTQVPGGVSIVVVPGPRARVEAATIRVRGEADVPALAELRRRVELAWPLPAGATFRSPEWDRAKRELLGTVRDAGYLRARIDESEALVERDRALASLVVEVDPGARVEFGELVIGGLSRYPSGVVEGLATFRAGEPYDARRIVEYQTRLNGAGWFTTVNVRPDGAALERDPGLERVPIRVDVVERESKRWSLGGGYDTDRGFNVLAGWEHRNVFGLGVQTFNGVELDVERQVIFSTWETPQDVDGRRWQFGVRAEHRDILNDLTDASSVFASHNRRRGDIETAVSLQYQFETQSVVFDPDVRQTFDNRALVLGYSWTQRRFDSPIYPTKGYVLSGQLSGASEALASMQSFVRAYGFGYGIVPLAGADGSEFGRIVVRGEVGGVYADSRDGIPSTNLFRTGGGRSVRGYSSQSLGVPVGQATLGGRYLVTVSAEYQHLVSRDVALAAFYDYGNAADAWKEIDPVAGYGVGVRWRTPVGPLNLDLAYGEAVRAWRLHFSIGVVF